MDNDLHSGSNRKFYPVLARLLDPVQRFIRMPHYHLAFARTVPECATNTAANPGGLMSNRYRFGNLSQYPLGDRQHHALFPSGMHEKNHDKFIAANPSRKFFTA